MASAIELWHAEHVNFARLLDVLDEEVGRFQKGETPDYECMLDIVSYLREFGDNFHHPREDVAFERMVAHDPALRLPVNRLLQEHRAIAVAGEELVSRLKEIMGDAVLLRATVEAAAALYLAYYRHHLGTEEREILPRAAHLLTAQDWGAVAGAVPPGMDPLFGDPPSESYRDLREMLEARTSAA